MRRILLPLAVSFMYIWLPGCAHNGVDVGVEVGAGIRLYTPQDVSR